jgi:hypothetical protein
MANIDFDKLELRGYTSGALVSSYDYSMPFEGDLKAAEVIKAELAKYGMMPEEHFSIENGILYMTDEAKKVIDINKHGYAIEDRETVNALSDSSKLGIGYWAARMAGFDTQVKERSFIEIPQDELAAKRLTEQLKGVDESEYKYDAKYVYLTDKGKEQLKAAQVAYEEKHGSFISEIQAKGQAQAKAVAQEQKTDAPPKAVAEAGSESTEPEKEAAKKRKERQEQIDAMLKDGNFIGAIIMMLFSGMFDSQQSGQGLDQVLDKIFKENGMSVSKEDIAAIVAAKDKLAPQILADLQKGMSVEDLAKTHGAELQKIPELKEMLPRLIEAAEAAKQAGTELSKMVNAITKDGKIDQSEYNASTPDQKAAAARADLNKDGVLEVNEMAAVLRGLDPKIFENFHKNVEQKPISLNTGPTVGFGNQQKTNDFGPGRP